LAHRVGTLIGAFLNTVVRQIEQCHGGKARARAAAFSATVPFYRAIYSANATY
jgi:hypothetical protein